MRVVDSRETLARTLVVSTMMWVPWLNSTWYACCTSMRAHQFAVGGIEMSQVSA
jgi:hypothetical protein